MSHGDGIKIDYESILCRKCNGFLQCCGKGGEHPSAILQAWDMSQRTVVIYQGLTASHWQPWSPPSFQHVLNNHRGVLNKLKFSPSARKMIRSKYFLCNFYLVSSSFLSPLLIFQTEQCILSFQKAISPKTSQFWHYLSHKIKHAEKHLKIWKTSYYVHG